MSISRSLQDEDEDYVDIVAADVVFLHRPYTVEKPSHLYVEEGRGVSIPRTAYDLHLYTLSTLFVEERFDARNRYYRRCQQYVR